MSVYEHKDVMCLYIYIKYKVTIITILYYYIINYNNNKYKSNIMLSKMSF